MQDVLESTSDLYLFLLEVERVLADGAANARVNARRLQVRATELASRLAAAREAAGVRLQAGLDDARARLTELSEALDGPRLATARLRARWTELGKSYEALLASVREMRLPRPRGLRLGHIKPRNYARNVFHVSMALMGVLLYELAFDQTGMLILGSAILTTFVGLDVARRLSPRFNEVLVGGAFGRISRPGEAHKVPAATWYMAALLLGAAILPQRAIGVGVMVLGFGDPIAALVGKRWGRRRLVGDKSLAGALGFVAAGLVAAGTYLALVRPDLGALGIGALALAAAVTGAVTELLSGRVDDNFTIPLTSGAVAWLVLALLGG